MSEKKKVLERAQRLKIKGKTPAEMLASKRANAAELAKAQADYDQWQLIAGVRQRRAEAKAAAELEAKAAADAERRRQVIDDRSEMVYPSDNYSNFALHLAAMYKATDYSQRSIADRFNRMYDLIQGMVKPNLLNPNPDNTPRSMADAIKEILGIDYQPAKNSIENGGNGSDAMAVGDRGGRSGRPGGSEPPASGEPTEEGERGADGGTGAADDSAADGRRRNVPLSDQREESERREIADNGTPFVLSANGTTTFGEITEDCGMQAAPIKLSEGYHDEATGKGNGLAHIEYNHGKQIKDAGFSSVEEFVSFVAENFDHDNIRVGKLREDGTQTFLIQVTNEHDNTLFIELSKDGSYWNVNSGGIFRKGYSNKKETVAKTEPQQPNNAVSSGSSLSEGEQSGISSSEPNGKPTVSEGKGSDFASDKQGDEGKSFVQQALGAQPRGDGGWLSGEGYTISPKPYTNRQGKTLDTYLVSFDRDFSKEEMSALRAKAKAVKGWYDPKSGEVVVNLSRNRNVGDVAETMLHEVVAHKGLRELVGEDGYSDFLREVYEHCKADMRKKIADKAADNGWDFEKATDEYLGELSEKGFEDFTEGERSIWQKLKQKVLDAINKLLKGIKLPKWVKLGDNELRYMLWRSHENLRSKPSARNAEGAVADKVADYVEMAADVAKRAELGLDRVNVYRLGDRPETFRSRHEAAVINRGTVMPGLNDARIKVVEGRRHGYMGKDALTQAVRAASQRYDGITMMYDNYGASFEYTIRPRTLKYAANHASESTNNGIHIAVMDILDKVIGESIEVMEHADVHKKEGKRIEENGYTNDTLMHRFVGAVRIGGAVYRVISTLKEYDTNKKPGHHTYEVTKIEVLDTDTPSTSNGTATDEGASVEVAKVIKDCEIHNKTGLKILQESEREDSELLFRDPGETDDIWHDGSLGLEERITNATLRLSNNQRGDLTLRNDAMRAVCDNLQTLLHDMRNRSGRTSSFKGADARVERGVAQSARAWRLYDRVTVKRVADLARVLMQNGYLRDMTSGEMQRIVSALKNTLSHSAHNAEGAVATVEKIMDIMIDNQVRSGSETLKELMSIRGSRVDSRGVEVQGELDADGARMMQAVRRGMKLSETEIQNKIAEAVSRMGDSDQTIADDAALEYAGMQIALDYVQNITGSKNEEKDLRDGLKDAKAEKDAGRMTAEAYNQLVGWALT